MPIGNFPLIEIMGTHKEDSIPRLRLGIVFDITFWLELCLKKQFPFH